MTNTTRNWKTTTMGVLIILGYVSNALLAFLQTGAMPSIEAATLAIGSGLGLIFAKDGNKTGIVRLLILAPACLMLVSCSTSPTGEKTFLGLTQDGWITTGKAAGKGAVQAGLPVALETRARTAAKQPVNVQP